MELIVFDLDGTLLNGKSQVSEHTQETLRRMRREKIAYTVATGRTLHAARDMLRGHGFSLPHIFKNGVMTWRPEDDLFSHCSLLTNEEIRSVLQAFDTADVSPFVFTLEGDNHHVVYHPPLRNQGERDLVKLFARDRGLEVHALVELPADASITNISALGAPDAVSAVAEMVAEQQHLIAYSGTAIEGEEWYWIDVHHSDATKGNAIDRLKRELGFTRVVCFGDSDNDLSMFAMADESYAPSNAKAIVLAAATEVIGHHDEEGISEFLRRRFGL